MTELKKLKRSKATGADNLPPGLLKDCAEEISQHVGFLINLSIESAEIPTEWKHALITPILKKGKVNQVDNYRPISVLPTLSKILERAVHTQLIDYLENNFLLSDQQFGYRRKRSTDKAATLFVDNARKAINHGELMGAVFIDLSKAFDTVGHSILLSKLPSYGILENELDWFTNYLFNRTQQVVSDKVLSDSRHITCGVPQGSILGPLLFLIHFNDFEDTLKRCQTIMFADDTVIFCSSKSSSQIEKYLNDDLKNVAKYLEANDLIINLNKGKTESMLFGTAAKLKTASLNLAYEFIQIEPNFII